MSGAGRTTVDPRAVAQVVHDVPDPEMPAVTLGMLGVVHDIAIEDDHVAVELLPTFVGCPATDVMAEDVQAAAGAVDGVGSVSVRFRYDPPWTPERISEAGREALQSFGIAPPVDRPTLPVVTTPAAAEDRTARPCPYCGSDETEREGLFGPTPCRDVRFCPACQQPFEAFRS